MKTATQPLLDDGDRKAMTLGFCAAATTVALLALRCDWILAACTRSTDDPALAALSADLLPWAVAFTLIAGAGACIGAGFALQIGRARQAVPPRTRARPAGLRVQPQC